MSNEDMRIVTDHLSRIMWPCLLQNQNLLSAKRKANRLRLAVGEWMGEGVGEDCGEDQGFPARWE